MTAAALQIPFPQLDALPLGAHRVSMLTDQALFDACGVRIAFTGRAGGVSTGDFSELNCGGAVGDAPEAVAKNRERVLEALGAASTPCIVPKQVHGNDLVCVDALAEVAEADALAREGADGVIVKTPGFAALLNFADCLPLIIVAPTGSFAVVHCGWRGTVAHIARKAVERLALDTGCDPAQMNAYIGPHIRECHFEVGEEVVECFVQEFGEDALCDPRHVSLAKAVRIDLACGGMDGARIVDSEICTVCQSDVYFSYRASGGTCGRHAAVAFRMPSS